MAAINSRRHTVVTPGVTTVLGENKPPPPCRLDSRWRVDLWRRLIADKSAERRGGITRSVCRLRRHRRPGPARRVAAATIAKAIVPPIQSIGGPPPRSAVARSSHRPSPGGPAFAAALFLIDPRGRLRT